MDKLTKKQRSECMSHIKGKNTGLEKIFRKSVSGLGIRGYRLNAKAPGRPDMYFSKRRIAVFIDGCFWHGCPRCASFPATNIKFWKDKIKNNQKRDRAVSKELHNNDFWVIRFWGHDIKNNPDRCAEKLLSLLRERINKASLKPKSALKYE